MKKKILIIVILILIIFAEIFFLFNPEIFDNKNNENKSDEIKNLTLMSQQESVMCALQIYQIIKNQRK